MPGVFLFSKIVDMSTLYEGISIPVAVQHELFKRIGFELKRGEQVPLVISMFGHEYSEAVLKNQWFDNEKYPNRKDIVQIRYSKNSLISQTIRSYFSTTTAIVNKHLSQRTNTEQMLVIPEYSREYISVYADKGYIFFDCIRRPPENNIERQLEVGQDHPQKRDRITSTYVRSASVVEQVKIRADGFCQLCKKEAPFKDKEGKPYLEVHHIIWLSRGGPDTIENAVALCPNCHSKMHIIDDPTDIAILLEESLQPDNQH